MNLPKTFGVLTELRQHLHKYPELSGHETNTRTVIERFISGNCPHAEITHIADTGLLVTFKSGLPGKKLLLRCDIDALPIDDEIEASYQSVNSGVGHKCGHDGHSAIMCGVAMELQQRPPSSGVVSLLFQPAEENGEGAVKCYDEIKRGKHQYDFVFALHNIPGIELGKILWKEGVFTPAVISVAIHLKGSSSHAAEPWNGNNPASVFGEIIDLVKVFEKMHPEGNQNTVLTPVFAKLGSRDYGISPGKGEVHFTIRSGDNEQLKKVLSGFEQKVKEICINRKMDVRFTYFQKFESISNDSTAVTFIRSAAEKLHLNAEELKTPYSWGEDFGVFTSEIPGAMFGIGAGEKCTALHSTTYDFPDELIPHGVSMFNSIIRNLSH